MLRKEERCLRRRTMFKEELCLRKDTIFLFFLFFLRLWACGLALLFFGPSKQYAKPWRHAYQKIIILEQNLITLL
jgi:hypothetical protein